MQESAEIRKWVVERAKYLIVPNKGRYEKYSPDIEEKALKVPLVLDSTYGTWSFNEHHFKPFYHFDYILPYIDKLFGFGFSESDFRKVDRKSGIYDTTYLSPLKNFNFDVYGFSKDEHFTGVNYSFLTSGLSGTDYHKQYRYFHECSRIINNSIDSSRILFVSGDSTLIPDIPVLACYFKEVWYFDNRDGRNHIKHLGEVDKNRIEVLFQVGFAGIENYSNINLL